MKIFLTISFWMLVSGALYAQALGEANDRRLLFQPMLQDKDSMLLGYLEKAGILETIDFQDLAPDTIFQVLFHQLEENWKTAQSPLKEIGLQASVQTFYTSLDTTDLINADPMNWHSIVNASQEVQLGKLPLSLGGTGVWKNNVFQPSLSKITVNFSVNDLVKQEKERYLEQFQVNNFFNDNTAFLNIKPNQLEQLTEQIQWRFYAAVLTSPAYIEKRIALEEKMKELNVGKDSLRNTLIDSSALHQEILHLKSVSTRYQALWEKVKNGKNQLDHNELKANLTRLNEHLDIVHRTSEFKTQLRKRTSNSAFERLLLLTKEFQIGRFTVGGGLFALRHFAANGLRYSWETDKLFGTVAYGSQALQYNSSFTPFLQRGFLQPFEGRKLFYARAGYGNASGDHLAIEFMRITEGTASGDTSLIYPKENTVVAFTGQTAVAEGVKFSFEGATAKHDLLGSNLDDSSDLSNLDRAAIEMSFDYNFKAIETTFGAGYFYVGASFISLGNPFLLTNRQGSVFSVKTSLVNRVFIDIEARFGNTINTNQQLLPPSSDWQIIGNAQWLFGAANSLSVGVSPNAYRQNGTGDFNTSTHSFLYHTQLNLQYDLGKEVSTLSLLGYSNFRADFQFFDTLQTNQSDFLFLQESVMFNNGNTLTLQATWGGDELFRKGIENSLYRGAYQWNFNNLSLSIGGQVLQLSGEEFWRYGSAGSLHWQVGQKIRWSGDWQIQRPLNSLENTASPWQIFANTGVHITL